MNMRTGILWTLGLLLTATCKDGGPADIDPPDPIEVEVVVDLPLEGSTFALGDWIPCTLPRILPSSGGTTTFMQVMSPSNRATRVFCGRPPAFDRFMLLEWDQPKPPIVLDEVGRWEWRISVADIFGTPVGGLTRSWQAR